MANCCSKCIRNNSPPQIISVTGQEDLVDIEHERTRQAAIALNVGKGPVKLEGKLRVGFERESFTRYKRHPPEERSESLQTIYERIGPVPAGQNTPVPMRYSRDLGGKKFEIPTGSEPVNIPPRRNSK